MRATQFPYLQTVKNSNINPENKAVILSVCTVCNLEMQ